MQCDLEVSQKKAILLDLRCADGLKGIVGVPGKKAPRYMGDCQNYGPFLGPYCNTGPNTGPNLGDPKRDHNFDNPPYMKAPEH